MGTRVGMRSENATAHFSLGAALEKKDDRAAAAQFRRALETGPKDRRVYDTVRVQAHCGLGSIALREGDIPNAIAQYQQALELDPDFTLAHMNLGGLLATQGKLAEAIVHFRRSVELQPDNVPIRYSLAIALAGVGKKDEAISNLNQALAIDPNFAPAKESLQRLSNR